jgi:HEAT repeat protein
MQIPQLLNDKSLKPKAKTETLSRWLLDGHISVAAIVEYAKDAKDPAKATCIEAIEFATGRNPEIADEKVLDFVTGCLTAKAPRIKWESAKVVGNIAHIFPGKLQAAIGNLLANTVHEGTVVRWAAAFALGEIIKLNTIANEELIPAINSIIEAEEKESIKKSYRVALRKLEKGMK